MVGLRALAADAGMGAVRTYLAAADDPMTAELTRLATELGDLPADWDEDEAR